MKQFQDDLELDEEEYHETVWVNNTVYTAKFKLMQEKTGKAAYSSAFRTHVLKPGDKLTLSSVFDDAIRTVDKNGMVVGGLCPWLEKEGEDDVEIHSCLDFESIAEELELQKIAVQNTKSKALEEAVKIMAEKKASGIETVAVKNKGGRPKKRV
jgi:hypothetical protein